MADHLVKLVHARDLAHWSRFPAYEQHAGKTLAQHQAEVSARKEFESSNWQLIEAEHLVNNADTPKVYATHTLYSPWPISLPGRHRLRLPSPEHSETTFDSDIGRVENGELILPLFIKEREVKVHYLAPDRVTLMDRIVKAKTRLAHTSVTELARLRAHLNSPAPEPVLFVSHRWESLTHPDPDGQQLEKLKALQDCYLIYDFTSFPQNTSTPEARSALHQVLEAMNAFIDNVLVLAHPDYMSRGWCLYEYIAGSLSHQIVCDEINNPALVQLRNFVATHPNPPGIGSTHREAVNAKNEFVLKAVNALLPVFSHTGFTVPEDRMIVQNLLIRRLRITLPRKQEYTPYVGEWKTVEWTDEELAAAFEREIQWEPLQYDETIPIFKPAVPDTIGGAVAVNFRIEEQPADFGRERYNWDWSGIPSFVRTIKIIGGAVTLLLSWALYRAGRTLFGK